MIAIGDLGAVLRWVGLVAGTPLSVERLASADALLPEIIEYLKVRHDGRAGSVASGLAEVQIAVHEWYSTWPIAGRLAHIASGSGVDIDVVFLTPIALAAELGVPLATTSSEIAALARPHVSTVLLV